MPNKLRQLSGNDVIRFCERNGFAITRTRGSHVNMARIVAGHKQVVTIPKHDEIDRGTLRNVFKMLMPYISENELRLVFYTSDK